MTPTPPPFRPFLVGYLLTLAALIAAVVGANALIDPKGYLGWVSIPGLNAIHYYADGSRIEKSIQLARGRYDALIAGSSRAQIGLDPSQPALAGHETYNSAMVATNVYEIEKVLHYARAHQDIKLLVWGLDFLTFSTRRTVRADFADSDFSGRRGAPWALDYLLSLKELRHSLITAYYNATGRSQLYSNPRGFIDKSGTTVEERALFTSVLTEKFLTSEQTYGAYEYGPDRVEMFHQAVESYAGGGAQVVLFISPIHAWLLEALRGLGLYGQFEDWKRDLVGAVAEINAQDPAHPVVLWDFSGYTAVTTEPVPPASEPDRQLRWYWECSHYRKALGDAILSKVLHGETAQGLPEDFGVELRPETLERQLLRIRQDRETYAAANRDDVALVRRLVDETAPARAAEAPLTWAEPEH